MSSPVSSSSRLVESFDLLVDRLGVLDLLGLPRPWPARLRSASTRWSAASASAAASSDAVLSALASVFLAFASSLMAFAVLIGRPAGTLTRAGGFRRTFGHIVRSFEREAADCHGPTSAFPQSRLTTAVRRVSVAPIGRGSRAVSGALRELGELHPALCARPRRCSARRPVSAGFWRSPTSCWRRRCSPSRSCSAASSTRWPAASRSAAELDWNRLILLLGAWVGFALFTIVAGTLISLHADRLSHRQYQVVRTMFFEHVLQLPLSYHTGAHSGRLVKVMVTGTNTLWSLWLAFFREHFVSIISLLVLLPATLFVNWRYGLLLIVLCCVFAVLIALHHFAKREAAGQGRALLQRRVRAHHRHARQHRAGAELHPHRERSARHEEARRRRAQRAAPGAVVVGAGDRDHAARRRR